MPHFPSYGTHAKAAQRWLDKSPLERSEGIIRDWGVLEYLPADQKRWSKALIRDGVADVAAALGRVLGISPELLRVRSGEGQDDR